MTLQRCFKFEESFFKLFIHNSFRSDNERFRPDHRREKADDHNQIEIFNQFEEIKDVFKFDRISSRLCFMIFSNITIFTEQKDSASQKRSHERKISKAICKKNLT
jgi:hypothetical protein